MTSCVHAKRTADARLDALLFAPAVGAPAAQITVFALSDSLFSPGAAQALACTANCEGALEGISEIFALHATAAPDLDVASLVSRGPGPRVATPSLSAGASLVVKPDLSGVAVSVDAGVFMEAPRVVNPAGSVLLGNTLGGECAGVRVYTLERGGGPQVVTGFASDTPPLPVALCVQCERDVPGAERGCSGRRHRELTGCHDGFRRVYDVVPGPYGAYFCAQCMGLIPATNSFISLAVCPASPALWMDSGRCNGLDNNLVGGGAHRVALPWQLMVPYSAAQPPSHEAQAVCVFCQRRCESETSAEGFKCCIEACTEAANEPTEMCYPQFLARQAGDDATCAGYSSTTLFAALGGGTP